MNENCLVLIAYQPLKMVGNLLLKPTGLSHPNSAMLHEG